MRGLAELHNPAADLTVHRISYGPRATIGLMLVYDEVIYTLEDPWANNAIGRSCIPDGMYRCRPRQFYRGDYPAVEITNVPGRTHILIHRGNTASDVTGCLLVGRQLDAMKGQIAVIDSRGAWEPFFTAWGGREFTLALQPLRPLAGTRTFIPSEET